MNIAKNNNSFTGTLITIDKEKSNLRWSLVAFKKKIIKHKLKRNPKFPPVFLSLSQKKNIRKIAKDKIIRRENKKHANR
jgi:hypothetical protein